LSYFNWMTWIAPNNVIVNQLFGFQQGLGLIPITFDWTQITGFTSSPLMFPFHAIANTLIGVVLFFMVTTIGLHYSGVWYAKWLPISDSGSYDNTGSSPYNVSRVLNSNFEFDEQAYQAYSPFFLSTTFALTYGLSFATITALITHTALFHGQEIWIRARLSLGEEPDVHTKMMRKYAEVPSWWYGVTFLAVLGLALASVLAYPTDLTWWAFFIALAISLVFAVPIGMIQAITNIQLGLNVITEFIIGYMQPGRPIAMMLFKTYGYITMTQALAFAQDLKLGHYMKLPPRVMFSGQIIATVWSCFVQIGVMQWAFANIKNICARTNTQSFTCPNGRVFFNASIIWGLVGPARIFSSGQIYGNLMYFFIVGTLTPPLFYFLARTFPRSNFRFLNAPLIFGGSGAIPPATTLNYTSWGIVGFVFNKYIKNRYRGWWSNYNYITSAGMDTGLALSTIVIFLCLQLTNQTAPVWWGNTVISTTLEANYQAIQVTGETFGPTSW
jgi:OPT family small oligopeptide transporter